MDNFTEKIHFRLQKSFLCNFVHAKYLLYFLNKQVPYYYLGNNSIFGINDVLKIEINAQCCHLRGIDG